MRVPQNGGFIMEITIEMDETWMVWGRPMTCETGTGFKREFCWRCQSTTKIRGSQNLRRLKNADGCCSQGAPCVLFGGRLR